MVYHDLIGASELHVKELELRERELKEKNNQTRSEKIERIQLYCYRLISNHHTDLIRIFNSIVLLVALFGIFTFFLPSIEISHSCFSCSLIPRSDFSLKDCFGYVVCAIFCIIIFVAIFFGVLFIDSKIDKSFHKLKVFWVFFYLSAIFFVVIKPDLAFPFLVRLFDKEKWSASPELQLIGIVYDILMFLLLFSLQKTVRKNSIIQA